MEGNCVFYDYVSENMTCRPVAKLGQCGVNNASQGPDGKHLLFCNLQGDGMGSAANAAKNDNFLIFN